MRSRKSLYALGLAVTLAASTIASAIVVTEPAHAALRSGVTAAVDNPTNGLPNVPIGSKTTLTIRHKATNGTATESSVEVVTCTVYPSGPFSADGIWVTFDINIFCDAVLQTLGLEMEMVFYTPNSGYWWPPDAYSSCGDIYTSFLPCLSRTKCYQAGATYWGYAKMYGTTMDGGYGEAYLLTDPRAIGCRI